jgi:hypothetical protein
MLTSQSDSAALYQKLCDAVCEIQGLRRERDEALMDRDDGDMAIMTRNHYERILKERDEAIRAIRALAEHGESEIQRITKERDEAITRRMETIMQCELYEQERDEARAAIPDGEWVAYEDHKKVHDAASRLLVAINKQLPIGSFSLISHEYHALKDAIYGKEGAK